MDISSDLRQFGERVLIGTGISLAQAVELARGGTEPMAPQACAAALRDGWVAALQGEALGEATAS